MAQSEKEGSVTTNISYKNTMFQSVEWLSHACLHHRTWVCMGAISNESFGREENYDHWHRKQRRSSENVLNAHAEPRAPISHPSLGFEKKY